MNEPMMDKIQELQDKVEVLERNFKYVKDLLVFEKQRYRDLEREVGRFENNFKYLQGVLYAEMTWREWINQYDPIEIVIKFSGYNPLSIQSVVLQWKTPVADMVGVASGNEWRSKDGRWYMRGEPTNGK